MSKKRPSLRRLLWVLIALLILILLWELNRWLPGAWPGGGGGSSITSPQPATGEAAENAPDRTPPDETDARRVERGGATPEWQRKGVTVEVRGFDGTLKTQWRFGLGDGGAESTPNRDGTLRATDGKVFDEGFRVRAESALVRHHFVTAQPARTWAVYMPTRTIGTQRLHPGTIQVQVVTGDDAKPVAGVEVRAFRPSSLEPARLARTDANGRAEIDGQRGVVRLVVEGKDRDGTAWQGDAWANPREREAVSLRVHLATPLRVSWTRAEEYTGQVSEGPFEPTRAFLVSATGNILAEQAAAPDEGPSGSLTMPRPARSLRGARLVLRHAVPDLGPPTATAEWSRAIPMDGRIDFGTLRPRVVTLRVRGPGGPIQGAVLRATYAPKDAGPEAPPLQARAVTFGPGRGALVVPSGVEARVLVEAPGHAPTSVSVPADTSEIDVTLEPGLTHRVQVRDARGNAARVPIFLRMSVDGVRLERVVPAGEALIDLPPGAMELFTGGNGHAWATTTADVAPGAGPTRIDLSPGRPLTMVVATPDGFPIEGVRAELFGMEAQVLVVFDPRIRAYESDAHGVLTVPDLPVQRYRVRLTAPGYRSLELSGLAPGDTTHFVSLVAHTARDKRRK